MLTRIVDVRTIAESISRAKYLSKSKVILVVKANAYGAGYEAVGKVADLVDGFAVARAVEGARLRKSGVYKDILVLSFDEAQARLSSEYGLIPAVSTIEHIESLKAYGVKECHVAVDTGMSRHGVKALSALKNIVNSSGNVKISGLFTHLFNNGAANVLRQAEKFDCYKDCLKSLIGGGFTAHVSASGALETLSGRYDAVRLGLAAYRGANYIVSSVIGVKRVFKGESVGYDGAFVAGCDMDIAIVEGGYADGIPRRFSGHEIVINSDFCKVIGNICMDVFMADVTGKRCRIGDRVVLLDNDLIALDRLSADTGRIEYETLTSFGGRINRVIFV